MQLSPLVFYEDNEKMASSAVQEIVERRKWNLGKSGNYSRYENDEEITWKIFCKTIK